MVTQLKAKQPFFHIKVHDLFMSNLLYRLDQVLESYIYELFVKYQLIYCKFHPIVVHILT